MIEYENNPVSIKYYVKKFLLSNKEKFKDKVVIDFPAGNGITSKIIKDIGGIPVAFDLFPEYFKVEDIKCSRANISEGLPLPEERANALICQEGIEHFTDQLRTLQEFNRVLKEKGTLLITTPNYSNLRAKLSYLLSESERFNSIMPPNELDSIWMSKQEITTEIYYGHIFLIGIQKLRVLAKLSGFKIKKIHFTRIKTTSLFLFPLFYPFIFISNCITYRKNLRKNKHFKKEIVEATYKEIFKISINPKILLDGHLMVEFEKEINHKKVGNKLKSQHQEFGTT